MRKLISSLTLLCFILSSISPTWVHASAVSTVGISSLPTPGSMVQVSPTFEPALIKGLTVHKDNPFLFDFVVDTGNDHFKDSTDIRLREDANRLIKYFFACLTIPEKDLWVNLSPYEQDRIAPDALKETALGSDLLAQDYILKQLTASLIYPEKDFGREFWDRVYTKAQALYGTTEIPVNTFNKVWILADKATVYEHGQTAYVVGGHLKVMLEEDYLSLQKHARQQNGLGVSAWAPPPGVDPPIQTHPSHSIDTGALGNKIIRDLIIPELEKEVNTGKNFATLRQIYNSLILASWYKKNLKQALLNQVYSDKSTVKGLTSEPLPLSTEQIYQQYLQAYKKGVFNYVKEDKQSDGQTIPRKYFSGGFGVDQAMLQVTDDAKMAQSAASPTGDLVDFAVAVNTNEGGVEQADISTDIAMTAQDQEQVFLKNLLDGKTILLIDTVPGNMDLIRAEIKRRQLKITLRYTSDTTESMRLLKETRIDAVIINEPVLAGRIQKEYPQVPLTAWRTAEGDALPSVAIQVLYQKIVKDTPQMRLVARNSNSLDAQIRLGGYRLQELLQSWINEMGQLRTKDLLGIQPQEQDVAMLAYERQDLFPREMDVVNFIGENLYGIPANTGKEFQLRSVTRNVEQIIRMIQSDDVIVAYSLSSLKGIVTLRQVNKGALIERLKIIKGASLMQIGQGADLTNVMLIRELFGGDFILRLKRSEVAQREAVQGIVDAIQERTAEGRIASYLERLRVSSGSLDHFYENTYRLILFLANRHDPYDPATGESFLTGKLNSDSHREFLEGEQFLPVMAIPVARLAPATFSLATKGVKDDPKWKLEVEMLKQVLYSDAAMTVTDIETIAKPILEETAQRKKLFALEIERGFYSQEPLTLMTKVYWYRNREGTGFTKPNEGIRMEKEALEKIGRAVVVRYPQYTWTTKVWVNGEKETLTEVSLIFQLKTDEAMMTLQEQEDLKIKHLGGRRVLVVDDEDYWAHRTKDLLDQRYQVQTTRARDGKEALKLVEQAIQEGEPFDAVITDLAMPRMRGDELIQEIRRRKIPGEVIIWSSVWMPPKAEEFLEQYGIVYLPKDSGAEHQVLLELAKQLEAKTPVDEAMSANDTVILGAVALMKEYDPQAKVFNHAALADVLATLPAGWSQDYEVEQSPEVFSRDLDDFKGFKNPVAVHKVNDAVIVQKVDLGDMKRQLVQMPDGQKVLVTSVTVNLQGQPRKVYKILLGFDYPIVFLGEDQAMGVEELKVTPGGIDLNSDRMSLTVTKDFQGGVQVNFDPAWVERIKQQGVQSMTPVIINITPLTDIRSLLGLATLP